MYIKKNPIIVFVFTLALLTTFTWIDPYIPDPRLSMILYGLTIIIFIYSSYLLINDFEFESNYFKHVFYLLILYEFFIIFNGVRSHGVGVISANRVFWSIRSGYYTTWPLVIPLFVFFDKKIPNFILLFESLFKLGILALILLPLFPSLYFTRALSVQLPALTYGCGILLLFATYISDKKVNISFVAIFITLLAFTYLARRNNIVTSLGFILSGYLINIRSSFRPQLFKYFPLLLGIGFTIAITMTNFTNILTSRLSDRLTEDSRSNVLIDFFAEMKDYMVFGKGINGTYYSPSGGEIEDEGVVFAEVDYRDQIETGYLQLVLSGGITYVVIFLLVLVPAAINGIFRSRNLFTKACGVIIFLWLIDMFIFGLPILSFHYIFVWICVGVCYKSSIRQKTDDEIRLEFENNTYI